MKKILLTLAAIIGIAATTFAQDEQTGRNRVFQINLEKCIYAHHNEKLSTGQTVGKILTGIATGQTHMQATKFEGDVQNAIIKGLSGSHRLRYNDVMPLEPGNIAVEAIISDISASSSTRTWKDNKGKVQITTYYNGRVEVMLTLKDAASGEVLANPSFRGTGSGSSSYSTSDEAVIGAMNGLSRLINGWLRRFMPLQANIVEGATAKKSKQKEVYIDLGSREGAYRGLHLGVFEVKTVAGKEAQRQIGKLRIEEVQGEDISFCKVQGGGKEIKALLDAGADLRVISVE